MFFIDHISESTTIKFLGLGQFFHRIFVMTDLKIDIKQNKVMLETVRYGKFPQTFLVAIFWKFCKSLINRVPLLQYYVFLMINGVFLLVFIDETTLH